jgi:hypothetical protein
MFQVNAYLHNLSTSVKDTKKVLQSDLEVELNGTCLHRILICDEDINVLDEKACGTHRHTQTHKA